MSAQTTLPTWGRGVRALRSRLGMSQYELARQVGVSQAAISRLELGHVSSLPDYIRLRIAAALFVDPVTLFPYLAPDSGDAA